MPTTQPLPPTRYCARRQEGDLPAIAIEHPAFSASLLLQGAQLVRFSPRGQANWLWLSEQEPFQPGLAVRGGIPICWPWFGDPSRNPEPVRRHIRSDRAHGLVRQCDWQLQRIEETDAAVTLTLALDSAELEPGHWQGQARLTLRVTCSAHALEMTLETHNSGREPLHISQALHSYFPTPDIHRTRIHGLDRQPYVDALDGWQRKLQHGSMRFQGETDRIYKTTAELELESPASVLRLRQHNANSAVIWNPWQDKAQRLSHFVTDGWQRMFCVETANVLDDAICLAPGAGQAMGFHLSRLKPCCGQV